MKSTAEVNKNSPEYFSAKSTPSFSEQGFIWARESTYEQTGQEQTELKANENVNAYENVIGTCKRQENSDQILSKSKAITKLKSLNYRTPCKEIAFCLEIIFKGWNAKDGHWLYISQHYTIKTISCVIAEITKQHQRGDTTVQNPAKYFTYLITNFHKKKKKFRSTNGIYKFQSERGLKNA